MRIIFGAIVGYAALSASLFVLFTLAWLAIGSDGAFVPNSYEISGTWTGINLVGGFITALLGGFVCSKVGRDYRSLRLLAIAIVVLGVINLFWGGGDGGTRIGDVAISEAAALAVQPLWLKLVNPVIWVVAIMLGSRMARRP